MIPKFRVYNGASMEYNIVAGIFGTFFVNPSNRGLDENDSASISTFNTRYPDDTPLMQFTGLVDSDGLDVYEGDIIRQWLDDPMEPDGGFWWIAEVKMHKGCWSLFQIGFDYEGKGETPELLFEDEIPLFVIGNIYEHPELLKPQDQ